MVIGISISLFLVCTATMGFSFLFLKEKTKIDVSTVRQLDVVKTELGQSVQADGPAGLRACAI